MPPRPNHTFNRFGRSYHLDIDSGEDLQNVLDLDEALWVATSAPLENLHADPAFLAHLDHRGDHRLGVTDVRAAIRWLLDRLCSPRGVKRGNTTLALEDLATETTEGKRIHRTALKILRGLGTPEATTIDLAQVRRVKKAEESRAESRAGAALQGSAAGPKVRQFLEQVLATVGGGPPVEAGSKTTLEQFLEEAPDYVNWWVESQEEDAGILPMGEGTAAAWELYQGLRPKIDQYFALCDAVRIDPSLRAELWPWPKERKNLDFSTAAAVEAHLREVPLAPPDAQGILDPDGELNPRDGARFQRLLALVPHSGGEFHGFDRADWAKVQRLFAPYSAWRKKKPETPAADLGKVVLEKALAEHSKAEVLELIGRSRETTLVLDRVRLLEKLILYQAWMIPLVNSFVSFPDLYDPTSRALFEMGTLVIDGRHLELSVRVNDRTRHAKISDSSNMFVLYTKILDQDGTELYELAVPVTAGGRGTLQVEKRGIFLDLHGQEYDALVVQIVENPISLKEAMWAPFKILGATITGRIEKITEQAQEKLKATGAGAVDWLGQPPTSAEAPGGATPPPVAPVPTASPAPSKAGLLAGGGIAIAALGSSLAFITKTLSSLDLKTILGGLLAALLSILVPISIVAVLKLRKRDLSSILEGSGWAINARMFLTRSQARSFTYRPPFPDGAKGIRHRAWWFWILLGLALLTTIYFGLVF